MATDATRDKRHVVLARPGDILLIGNVGAGRLEDLDRVAATLRDQLGIPCVMFAGDIDVDRLSELERPAV